MQQQQQQNYWSCAFWADQLSVGKSDRNKKGEGAITMDKPTANQNDQQQQSLNTAAEAVLTDCLEQRNVPFGCLVAEFLFRNGGKRFDAKMATKCQITMSGYLNSLKPSGDNSLALCQFLAQTLPQFECTIPLHSLGVLLKILKTNLHQPNVVQLINSNHLIHLWHHCFYQERGPSELNKSIAKNLIAILKVIGRTTLIELFNHFLLHVPYFFRHKYLLMQYLLSSCPIDQLDESVLLQFFGQLSLCLEGRWCEAELADAFHAMALRFLEMDKAELLAQSILKTLTSNNEAIRENAVRLWFPKLNTSQQLRQTFLRLRSIFRNCVTLQQANTSVQNDGQLHGDYEAAGHHHSLPYWFYDSIVDPSTQWSLEQINLWSFLQFFYWTIKNKIAISDADLLEEDLGIAVNAIIGCDKDAIKKIAVDSLALLFVSKRPKWHSSNRFEPLLHQFVSNFEHLMPSENANLCDSVISLINNLIKIYDQEVGQQIKCQIQKMLKKCSENIESTNSCPIIVVNVMHLIDRMDLPLNDELNLDVQIFLLNALVYENDSSVRQQSAQMALRHANDCANFKQKMITLFNKMAPQLKYGIVHLYRLLLCLQIDQRELDLHFLENDDDGLNILFTRTKYAHSEPTAPTNQIAIAQFLSHCIDVNEKLLKFGGSDCAAHCVTVSELHLLFEKCSADDDGENDDDNNDLLFWSDTQKKQLLNYSNGIIQSCSAIRWILTKNVAQIDEQSIQNGLRSIWTVLLRSHHKGILEHCGSDFCAIVEHLCANLSTFPQIREEIVEKTLAILSQEGGGQCRNIAFAKILLPIFASIGPIQRVKLINQIIAFDLHQNAAAFCTFDQTKLHLHQLFLLKELLCTTKFNLLEPRPEIFRFIMRITQIAMESGKTERWRLFSMVGNAFTALLHSIFRHFPGIVPLHTFYHIERNFCDNLLACLRNIRLDLAQKRRSEPSIALLLVPLQRLFIYANPIENCCCANEFIAELSSELRQLIRLEPSFLLKRQMSLVIANLKGQQTHTQ